MTVYIPLIGLLWRTMEAHGFDPARIIPEKIYQPGAEPGIGDRISLEVFEGLLTRAVALLGDPTIGLCAAKQIHPSHLGALGHAWMASNSLRTAIMRTQRFHRMLHEQLTIHVSEPPGFLQIEYRQPGSLAIRSEQVDARLGSLLHLCRFNFGADLTPAYVRMRRPEPADPTPWTRFFGTPVQFGAALDCLAFHVQDADKPLTVSSPQLVSVTEDMMIRYLAGLDRSKIADRVRAVLLDLLPSGQISEQSVAGELHITLRTLRNRLRKEETTFRSLLTDLRKDLARSYLSGPSYSITEISFLLGYANTSSFARAFRSWFGSSPSEYRQSRK
jgi:AraC-like DNA-binding protein